MRHFLLLTLCALLTSYPAAPEASPGGGGWRGDAQAWFKAEHRDLLLSFETTGTIMNRTEWPDIDTPRKFSLQVDVSVGETTLNIMLFKLDQRGGDWWLTEVMGFLFDPMVKARSFVTARGREAIYIDIPGGAGVHPQREALILFPEAAIRITCPSCAGTIAADELDKVLDSMSVSPSQDFFVSTE